MCWVWHCMRFTLSTCTCTQTHASMNASMHANVHTYTPSGPYGPSCLSMSSTAPPALQTPLSTLMLHPAPTCICLHQPCTSPLRQQCSIPYLCPHAGPPAAKHHMRQLPVPCMHTIYITISSLTCTLCVYTWVSTLPCATAWPAVQLALCWSTRWTLVRRSLWGLKQTGSSTPRRRGWSCSPRSLSSESVPGLVHRSRVGLQPALPVQCMACNKGMAYAWPCT